MSAYDSLMCMAIKMSMICQKPTQNMNSCNNGKLMDY